MMLNGHNGEGDVGHMQGGVRGVAGVAAATPFFEPEKIRNFVFFISQIDYTPKKKSCYTIFKILTPSLTMCN